MSSSASREAAIRQQLENLELIAHATPPASAELQRIADAIRRLGRFANTAPDEARLLAPVAEGLEAVIAGLPGNPDPQGACGGSRFYDERELDPHRPMPNPRGTHPLLGCVSPVAPPLDLRAEGEQIVADVAFDVRFEGNRGWVHGGFVAAGFDIMAVSAARLSGRGGPTGSLQVRYVLPTPVGEPLRYSAWPVGEQGRKIRVEGELRRCSDDALTARMEGIVVAMR